MEATMSVTVGNDVVERDGPSGPSRGKLKGWLYLAAFIASLVLFGEVIGPWGLQLPYFNKVAQYIEDNNINANAYYYTEVAEFSEADFALRALLGENPVADRFNRSGD